MSHSHIEGHTPVLREVSSLGLTLKINVPSTVEAYDALAKKTGAALESAIQNELYRGSLTEFRDQFVDLLEAETSITRKTKDTGKTRDVKVTKVVDGNEVESVEKEPVLIYDETEAEYVKRVCAERNCEVTAFQPLADRLSEGGDKAIVFDPSATERKSAGPKKLAKKYLDAAQSIITGGKTDLWMTKYGGDGAVETIAKKIKELEDAEAAKVSLSDKFLA